MDKVGMEVLVRVRPTIAQGSSLAGWLLLTVAAGAGCWPTVPDGWEPDQGAATTRVRAVEGDTFVKLKEGLARTLYQGLDGEERCVEGEHCRRKGAQIVCSTENVRDPYVCELHLVDGAWVAPRDDWELYHSLEANRRAGSATWDGATLNLDGDAGEALAAVLGVQGPLELGLTLPDGTVGL